MDAPAVAPIGEETRPRVSESGVISTWSSAPAPIPTTRSSSPIAEPAASLDITKDPETLSLVFDAVRLLAGGVALIYFSYTIYNLTRLEVPGVSRVMLLDQIVIAISALIFWLSHTRRIPQAWVHVLSATLALSVAANTSRSVVIYGESSDLQYMTAVAIGGAAIVVSRRWLAVVLVGTMALALPAVLAVCTHDGVVDFVVGQLGASIVAVIIFTGRVRGQRKLLKYRIHDASKTRDLKAALRRAEREFEEHQVAEKQKLALMDQLRQAQKLEALGTLAGGVAHDINNVIGAITAIASTTVQELPQGAAGRIEWVQILVAARRATTLTRNLVRFARQDQPKNAAFLIDEVVLEVEALLRRTLAKHIELRANCGCAGWAIMGDAGLISHALMNLCLNSADAIRERGSITIETKALELGAVEAQALGVSLGEYVELLVRDDGHGMSPDILERAFEPFFSTKENKRRSGLGLPMVYGTIQQHQGIVRVESQLGQGTQISLILPALRKSVAPVERKAQKVLRIESRRPVALFVDDEPLLRRAGRRMLSNLGYEVMLAANGRDALDHFEKHSQRIGVVVLDVAMPVMSGAECCRELRRIDPSIPVVLASGFPKGHDLQSLLAVPMTRYVRKPYEFEDLAANLAELAEESQLTSRHSLSSDAARPPTSLARGVADPSPESAAAMEPMKPSRT